MKQLFPKETDEILHSRKWICMCYFESTAVRYLQGALIGHWTSVTDSYKQGTCKSTAVISRISNAP